MIVREPISRFISGFIQICVLNIGLQQNHSNCFNCRKNMKCFIERLYNHTQNLNRKLTNTNIFIMYHFYPQSWYC
uniref:Ovule protein n=1 Tax=Strongyloides papillosus TaxID=174720 RepID=A0A0N5CCT9_STREA